ncbi:MAG: peptidase dimerization domain protein, partial [Fulvivirga sp.]
MTSKEFIDTNKNNFINELLDLLRIPSISADSKFKDDVRKAANFIKSSLETAGADKAEICETAGHPIVYGAKII